MLEVKNLTKSYGDKKSVCNLSFSLGERETVGLLGPNGAGKSTTMRMICGYLAPTSGSVSMMGIDVQEHPLAARMQIGYLPELPPLYLNMTVTEHLTVVCNLRRIPKKQILHEIERVCASLHISDVKGRLIKNLSKGYRQRVGFAAALVGDPKLLILDEPTVGLDPRQVIEIRNLIHELSGKMSIILSSHILSEISSVCSRIIIMNKGHMLADGTQEEIQRQHGGPSAIELVVKGDPAQSRKVLEQCLGNRAQQIQTYDEGRNLLRYMITTNPEQDLREDLFHAFASQRQSLSLLTLRSMNKTLEDIFIDIIENSTPKS